MATNNSEQELAVPTEKWGDYYRDRQTDRVRQNCVPPALDRFRWKYTKEKL